jgi:hypothetical protein
MARSSQGRVTVRLTLCRGIFACAFALVVPLGACGQVTGLSDDYRFDQLADGGSLPDGESGDGQADGPKGDAPGTSPTDGAPDARESCTNPQQAVAQEQLTSAGGELLLACRNCLAANCCKSINVCASGNECDNSMKCVFNCQGHQGSAKLQCLNQCSAAFENVVGACIASACDTPTCTLK